MLNFIEKAGNRRITRSAFTVVLAVMFMLVYPTASKAFAQDTVNVAYKGSPFEFIGDVGIKKAKSKGFSKDINVTAEDKGIKITFKEVLCDNESISIGFTQECEGGFKDFTGIFMDWHIDGKRVGGLSGGIVKQKQIAKNKYAGVFTINVVEPDNYSRNFEYPGTLLGNYFRLTESGLPDEFKARVELLEVGNIRGEWSFEFAASNKLSKAATKTLTPGIVKTGDGASITVSKVKSTPSKLQLWVNVSPDTEFYACTYRLFDDKGNEIAPLGKNAFGSMPEFVPLDSNPEFIVLKPYNNSILHVSKQLKDGNFPVTLSQGKLGEVTIKKVEFLKGKTLIHFDFKPKTPGIKPGKIFLTGDTGEILGLAAGDPGFGKPTICVGGKSYVQEYLPVNNNGKLKLCTTAELEVEAIQELEVKIPLYK